MTLTVTPAAVYQVNAWSGVDNSDGATATVTINSDTAVTVEFVEDPEVGTPIFVPNTCGACESVAPANDNGSGRRRLRALPASLGRLKTRLQAVRQGQQMVDSTR